MKCMSNVLRVGFFLTMTALIANGTDLMVTNNLFLRLDGSAVTLNGSTVSAWSNLAIGVGVSAGFLQPVAGAQPTLINDAVGGLPALDFDGNTDHFYNLADSSWDWNYDQAANMVDAARWTMFFVCKPNVKSGSRFLLRSAYSDSREGTATVANYALWGAWFDGDDYSIHCRGSAGNWLDARWSDKWQNLY
ncbi:MAG: hypothetical protein PHO37_12775 [Kiritimatiellae bacterium]|nr:hypothetical protein [Kiritimatiellia bacterium]